LARGPVSVDDLPEILPMNAFRSLALMLLLGIMPVHAQDLSTTCHASSSYDITLRQDSLMFERPAPAPFHVQIAQATLRADGVAVALNAEAQDRLSLFDHDVRALAPRVRTVARHGVDIAVQAMHAEEAGMGLSAATRSEFDRRLAVHADELKQRIDASNSTRDWQGPAMDQTMQSMTSDLLPLLAADLGQQAVDAALSGDLQAASELRDRAADLAIRLQPRLLQRMQALRPQIQALCPAIRQLADLQQGLPDGHGHALNLLQIDP
jgi:hypothetical protein